MRSENRKTGMNLFIKNSVSEKNMGNCYPIIKAKIGGQK